MKSINPSVPAVFKTNVVYEYALYKFYESKFDSGTVQVPLIFSMKVIPSIIGIFRSTNIGLYGI